MRRFLRRLLIWAVLVPAGVYLALALVFWVWGTIQLHLELKRWEALGVLTRLEDTRPSDVPPETNAAPLYESLRGRLQLSDAEKEALGKPWEIADPAAFIEPYKDILATLHEAAKRPNLVWERKYYERKCPGPCTCDDARFIWNDIMLRPFARLLIQEARARQLGGDLDGALDSLQANLAIVGHTGQSANFISFLLGIAIEEITLEAIRHLLPGMNSAQLARTHSMLPRRNWQENWREEMGHLALNTILESEEHTPYGECRSTSDSDFDKSPHPMNWPLMRGLQLINLAYSSSTWRLLHHESGNLQFVEPWDEAYKGFFSVFAMYYDLVFKIRMPFMMKARNKSIGVTLQESALRSAIEIMKQKNTNGSYPEAWEMPVDPYVRKPLEYARLEDGGFIVSRTTGRYDFENWEWRFP